MKKIVSFFLVAVMCISFCKFAKADNAMPTFNYTAAEFVDNFNSKLSEMKKNNAGLLDTVKEIENIELSSKDIWTYKGLDSDPGYYIYIETVEAKNIDSKVTNIEFTLFGASNDTVKKNYDDISMMMYVVMAESTLNIPGSTEPAVRHELSHRSGER